MEQITAENVHELVGREFRIQVADGYAHYRVTMATTAPPADTWVVSPATDETAQTRRTIEIPLVFCEYTPEDEYDDYVAAIPGGSGWVDAATVAHLLHYEEKLNEIFGRRSE